MEKNRIQVGDRVTYRFLEEVEENRRYKRQSIMTNEEEIMLYIATADLEVLKIERIGTKGWYTVYEKKEVLEDKEKKYLSNVIKPLKDKFYNIIKHQSDDGLQEWIEIELMNGLLDFPPFETETMYKKMKLEKVYNLKELGLDD